MEEQNKTDHDNLITIIEQVKTLNKSQYEFHVEMRRSFDELKNNWSGRLNSCEARLVKLETSKVKQNTTMGIGIGILTLIVSLLIYHIMGR